MENRITVVLADANEEFRTALQQTLENAEGFDVVGSAADGLAAAQLVQEKRPQLLVMDLLLPGLDGFGVLEVMKQRNWPQEIPVIITSSEDDESFIQKAYELGVTDHIRRPFNLTVTQRRVSNALTLYARQKHLVHLAEEQV